LALDSIWRGIKNKYGREIDFGCVSDSWTIIRDPSWLAAMTDAGLVMMSPNCPRYIACNETGRDVWNLLESPRTFIELCRTLSTEYDVDRETLRNDVEEFLLGLKRLNAVSFRS
jgi:hypothetical protein